jgi:uncharacterized protein YdaU (DUF1376 family)
MTTKPKVRHVDFYPDEWIAGTVGLDLAETGLYIAACALIYSRGGPVSIAEIRASVRCHGNAFNRAISRLIDLGKLSRNGEEIANKRCGNELEKAKKRLGNAQENGRKSGGRPSKINGLPKPVGYSPEKLTTNHQLPTRILNLPSTTTNGISEPRAHAREGGRQAGRQAEDKDFKICEEWIGAAETMRRDEGLSPADLVEEARKCVERWEYDPPRNRRSAWLGYAMRAKGEARPDRPDGPPPPLHEIWPDLKGRA